MTAFPTIPPQVFADAVRAFWDTRLQQSEAQRLRGSVDQGLRSAATGGKQMDGFARTIVDLMLAAGVSSSDITRNRRATLPGYFRTSKQWDLVVVSDGQVRAAIELKSISSSFGNNMNNRAEEVIGSGVDFWTAYREGAYGASPAPWLGYLFVISDVDETRTPKSVTSPHFPATPEFRDASYARRAELLCRRLVLERHYSAACLILADPTQSEEMPNYAEPAEDLAAMPFLTELLRHVTPR